MSGKRRDSKGRILRTGESQRKDGRYAYKYTDACGKTQFVYAWKLVPTDKTPTGKRDDISLREKVKEILRDLNDGIDTIGKKMTVCQLYARQNSHRMSEKGYAYKTINNWKRSLKAAFYTAIEDDCIRKNPFNFAMDTVLEDDTEEKVALTQEQEDRLLAFAGSDPVYRKYCDEIIVLLGTGLRVSELCGLTVELDFENRRIDVDHQLLRDSELGYYVDEPKTKKGARQIPMSEKVCQALKRAVKNRGKAAPVNIGGYTNFLFLNQSGLPKTASCYESMFQGLVRKYYHAPYLLHPPRPRWDEPQRPAVYHGTFQYHHDAELLRSCGLRLCESGDGQAGGLVVRPVFYYAFTTFDRQMRLRYAMICGVSSETQNAGNA